MECKNHKGVQTAGRCTECMEAFCANCLIVIQDEKYCRSCDLMMIQEKVTLRCKEASDALKIAIIGLIFIGIVLEPIAISKALKAKKIIKNNPRLTGSGKATAALIISIIYLLLLILFILALNFRTF